MALAPMIGSVRSVESACFLKQQAGDAGGNGPEHQQPQQHRGCGAAPDRRRRLTAAEALADDLHPVAEEIDEHGGQGSHVQRDIEGQTRDRASRSSRGITTRCAVLLTGRNSVRPWTMPRTMTSKMDI